MLPFILQQCIIWAQVSEATVVLVSVHCVFQTQQKGFVLFVVSSLLLRGLQLQRRYFPFLIILLLLQSKACTFYNVSNYLFKDVLLTTHIDYQSYPTPSLSLALYSFTLLYLFKTPLSLDFFFSKFFSLSPATGADAIALLFTVVSPVPRQSRAHKSQSVFVERVTEFFTSPPLSSTITSLQYKRP